ncbi:MAG: hypothetical protein GY742_06460 [Hyphomicrobiales bacterium]|nr:hypothetical protein [Hyphomicrobiales bacterium]
MAADIETLIRQALARQNGFDPQVRSKIYQASRNALAKMIAKSGAVPLEIIDSRNRSLEQMILKIEREFTAEMPASSTGPDDIPGNKAESQLPVKPESAFQVSVPQPVEPGIASGGLFHPPDPNETAEFTSDKSEAETTRSPTSPYLFSEPTVQKPVLPNQEIPNPDSSIATPSESLLSSTPTAKDNSSFEKSGATAPYAEPTPEYVRPKPKPFRYIIWVIAVIILAIAGWIAYTMTISYINDETRNLPNGRVSQTDQNGAPSDFITILQPNQPGALVTAGNGTAKIISETSQPAIRIMSVRKPDTPEIQADPLRLELAPGILKDIAGKKTTIEILAKSGDTGPATFSVSCDFGELGECGRKRFRVGLQPEAVVFSIQISPDFQDGQRAFLAINTDVTSAAALSGKGAKIDIIYARLRASL